MRRCGRFSEYSLHNQTHPPLPADDDHGAVPLAGAGRAVFPDAMSDRVLAYHAGIFRALIASGEIRPGGSRIRWRCCMSAPVRDAHWQSATASRSGKAECLEKLRKHVTLFFQMVHGGGA